MAICQKTYTFVFYLENKMEDEEIQRMEFINENIIEKGIDIEEKDIDEFEEKIIKTLGRF